MTSLTANPDSLFDAEPLAAWRPSARIAPTDLGNRHVSLPPALDVHYMLKHVALAEVTVLGDHWTEQILADARALAREFVRLGLCRRGKEVLIEELLVNRCEPICKHMSTRMLEAVENATLGNQRS